MDRMDWMDEMDGVDVVAGESSGSPRRGAFRADVIRVAAILVVVLAASFAPRFTSVGFAAEDAPAAPAALESTDWTEWIGPGGLASWTPSWKPGAPDPAHEWHVVGDVALDPADARRLVATPGEGALLNGDRGRTSHLFSNAIHGDCEIHVEFVVPKGSNSGVYLMGRYEIQVFDSWGVEKPEHSDCGGIYQRWDDARGRGKEGFEGVPPRVNASRPPGEWQSFDAIFRAPRFDAQGNKTADARFEKVVHNGTVVHENVPVTGPTRSAAFDDERPLGPLMLQGDHGPVAYRNVRIRALE